MKKLRVMLLVHSDLIPPNDVTGPDDPRLDDCDTEYDVKQALLALGHEVRVVGAYDELAPIRQTLEEWQPDIVFNLLEEFAGRGDFDYYVVSYLEMMGVAYTGCKPRGLLLARDKALSKKLLKYHHIRAPEFAVFPRSRAYKRHAHLPYPLIVKSLTEEGSVGIAQASFVETEEQLKERIRIIHETTKTDAIAEQYIPGRELYVTLLGQTRLQCLPIRELTFDQIQDGAPRMATYKVKWDGKYRERWGINFQFARNLPEGMSQTIVKTCRRICRVLDLNGYIRIDLRLAPDGSLYVLEANPNPGIASYEEASKSAEKAGIAYPQFIQRIVSLGLGAKHGAARA